MIEAIILILEIVVAIEISRALKGKRVVIRRKYIRAKRTLVNWIKKKFHRAEAPKELTPQDKMRIAQGVKNMEECNRRAREIFKK